MTVLVAHLLCGMPDVTLKDSGMLGTLTMGLTTDAFGPVSSNAGGIVEMSQFDEWVPTLLTQQGTPLWRLAEVLRAGLRLL